MSRIILKASYVGADLNRWALQSFQRDTQENQPVAIEESAPQEVSQEVDTAQLAPF